MVTSLSFSTLHRVTPGSVAMRHWIPISKIQNQSKGMGNGSSKIKASAAPTHYPCLLGTLSFIPPPACFDQSCQAAKDTFYILSLAVPLIAFGAFLLFLVTSKREGTVEIDSAGKYAEKSFEVDSEDESRLARDPAGEIAYRAVRYTPYLTEKNPSDVLVRLNVGPVNSKVPQNYVFEKSSPSSKLITVTLPRPLGIIFEDIKGSVQIVDLVENSGADQLSKRAKLDYSLRDSAPMIGDVLRGLTTTVVIYKEGALIAQGPEREIVVFGADGQKWRDVKAAMKRGLRADGDVTLVLERESSDPGMSNPGKERNSEV